MGVATARTVTLDGIRGHVIDVQADVRQGLISTTMVGRPDPTISESRDRCRTAIVNSRFEWPTTRRVTIALSPADLPKRGSHFDLAIALAVLAAGAREEPAIPVEALADRLFIGELTLDGRVRAVHGVIPMVMAARARGVRRVVVPDLHVLEAALVPDVEVEGVRSLAQAVALLTGEPMPDAPPVEPLGSGSVLSWRGEDRTDELDLADVHGMADARYALEVAAAGGHHLLLTGPKGAGKTTLAERLPGLLPDLGVEETLELVAVQSLAGEVPRRLTDARPPFRAPHHTASKVSVLGGGTGRVHPGEISRALHGVLLLDEFPLFRADIVDALRQPLESAEITITRGDDVATFPARSIVVLGANPCPCGDYSSDPAADRCTCGEVRRRGYREKFSAPVKDRIDIERHVMPVRPWEVGDPLRRPEDTATVRARVAAARRRAGLRLAGTAWRVNADVPGPVLTARWPMTPEASQLVDAALTGGGLTRRGATRVHRMAWTVADLDPSLLGRHGGEAAPGPEAAEVALRLRSGEPLAEATLQRRAG